MKKVHLEAQYSSLHAYVDSILSTYFNLMLDTSYFFHILRERQTTVWYKKQCWAHVKSQVIQMVHECNQKGLLPQPDIIKDYAIAMASDLVIHPKDAVVFDYITLEEYVNSPNATPLNEDQFATVEATVLTGPVCDNILSMHKDIRLSNFVFINPINQMKYLLPPYVVNASARIGIMMYKFQRYIYRTPVVVEQPINNV